MKRLLVVALAAIVTFAVFALGLLCVAADAAEVVEVRMFPTQIGGIMPVTVVLIEEGCTKDSFALVGLHNFPIGTKVEFLADDKIKVGEEVFDEFLLYPREVK